MFVSAAIAFLASAAAPQVSAPTTPPAEKPRRICRSEAVIGSVAAKRVCVTVPAKDPAAAAGTNGNGTGQSPKPGDTPQGSGSDD